MKKANKLILLFLIIFSGICNAQRNGDHLEPANSIFDIYDFRFEYYSKVRKVLFDGLSDRPEIRFLTIPSFITERVLQVDYDENNDKYYITYHICENSIWYNQYEKKPKQITVKKHKKEIEKQSVELIKSLYKEAIFQTKFQKKDWVGLDGANYYFYTEGNTGTIWSPSDNTKMAQLVEISNELIRKTTENNNDTIIVFDNDFQEKIKNLIAQLQE